MTTCKEIRGRMWAYLDDELDRSDESVVSSHLERCPECDRAFRAGRALLDGVSVAASERAPSSLRARVEMILESGQPETPAASAGGGAVETSRRSRRHRWAAALIPIAAVLATLLLLRPWAGTAPGDALAAASFAADHDTHAIAHPSGRPFDVDGERPPAPPRLAESRLVGLSRCVVDGRVYAHYVFATGGGTVSAFVPVEGRAPGATGEPLTVEEATVMATRLDGTGVVLVSTDLPPEVLTRLSPGT